MNILSIDVGGTHVKILATSQTEERKVISGPTMTAAGMADAVKILAEGWEYDRVSIGYPGPVVHGAPVKDPANLGPGWVGFDFSAALGGCPVKILNDAAMQALGDYTQGRMLFLGLGTGLGSAMIVDGIVEPMELAHLPYKKGLTYEDFVGLRGLERLGKKRWRGEVFQVVGELTAALQADEVVIGGGNAKLLKDLPPSTRLGDNTNAFKGGFRLWQASPEEQGASVVQTEGATPSASERPDFQAQEQLRVRLIACAHEAQAALDAAQRALALLEPEANGSVNDAFAG